MNENIDLTKILKDCPKGWKFYTPIWGEVTFNRIRKEYCDICIDTVCGCQTITIEGYYIYTSGAECIIFPSKGQRDWSKFTAPWYKKERFNPNMLKKFDKVIVRNIHFSSWRIEYFSHIEDRCKLYPFFCLGDNYAYCIPYNDETKHLVGTTEEAPEYYRYWEN